MDKPTFGFERPAPDNTPVRVVYVKDWMPGLDHFEFRSEATSSTGYRSHFVNGGIGDTSPEAAADQIIASLYKERIAEGYQPGQTKFF